MCIYLKARNVRDVPYAPWQSLCFFSMIEMAFLQKRHTGSEGCRDTLPYGENLYQVEGSLAYIPELPWASKRSLHFLTKLGDRAVYTRNKKLARQGHLQDGITYSIYSGTSI